MIWLERSSRRRQRFHNSSKNQLIKKTKLRGWRSLLAIFSCLLPILTGFVLPSSILVYHALGNIEGFYSAKYIKYAGNSFMLASSATLIIVSIGVFLAYAARICPNLIVKIAVRLASIGYAIPGFALGAVMLIYLGARGGWFPLFGLTSADFSQMNFFEQIMDLAHHTVLPLTCYVIGGFAWLTMMMKNNLMENLATNYVRTAVAKGVSFRSAVFKHAFRNSIIPIASTMGQLITMIVGGSILIESVFDIQGFGLLQYQALLKE